MEAAAIVAVVVAGLKVTVPLVELTTAPTAVATVVAGVKVTTFPAIPVMVTAALPASVIFEPTAKPATEANVAEVEPAAVPTVSVVEAIPAILEMVAVSGKVEVTGSPANVATVLAGEKFTTLPTMLVMVEGVLPSSVISLPTDKPNTEPSVVEVAPAAVPLVSVVEAPTPPAPGMVMVLPTANPEALATLMLVAPTGMMPAEEVAAIG